LEETIVTVSQEGQTKVPKMCKTCGTFEKLTKHHLKEWNENGKYRRTGKTMILCRPCHDKVEREDVMLLEQALINRVKSLMKAKRGGQRKFINRRIIRLIRALERLKECDDLDLFNAETDPTTDEETLEDDVIESRPHLSIM
jgi:hypothetical protein